MANWGEFDTARVQPAGKTASVGFRFRNARTVRFEAHEILIPKLLDDAKAYLKSLRDGMKFDLDQIELSELGPRMIQSKGQPYVGPLVASWDLALEPKAGHLDRRIVVETPLKKPGAYLLSARMADGNLSRIVVGIADTVIVKKPTPNGQYFFVADAISGRPVPDANLEFFGYHADVRRPARGDHPNRDPRLHQDHGARRPTDSGRQGPRSAISIGSRSLAPRPDGSPSSGSRTSGTLPTGSPTGNGSSRSHTDRPIYRPGQSVKFKCWVRRPTYEGPIDQAAAQRSFRVKINNPKDETVFEHDYTSDDSGGFDGEYALPKGASLGGYTLFIEGRNKTEEFDKAEFRVEEYKKPEFAVSIETPPEPGQAR